MKINNPRELSNFLKYQRKKVKRTQDDVSSKIGIQQQTISAIERNSTQTKLETLFRVISELDLELHLTERKSSLKSVNDWHEEW